MSRKSPESTLFFLNFFNFKYYYFLSPIQFHVKVNIEDTAQLMAGLLSILLWEHVWNYSPHNLIKYFKQRWSKKLHFMCFPFLPVLYLIILKPSHFIHVYQQDSRNSMFCSWVHSVCNINRQKILPTNIPRMERI